MTQVSVLLVWLNVGTHQQCYTNTIAQRDLVFWRRKFPRNSTGVNPYGDAKCRWGWLKSTTVDKKTGYILKTLQDGRVVSIKVEYEVVCALSNGYDLEWLLTAQTTPISAFCTAFHIFVVGVVRNFKFGLYRLTKASPSLLTTSHPWNGRGQGHVTHFYILCPRPYLWSEWS